MKLRRFKESCSGRVMIGPIGKEDSFLFHHCSNGSQAVTEEEFKNNVRPLIAHHGVLFFAIKDETKGGD